MEGQHPRLVRRVSGSPAERRPTSARWRPVWRRPGASHGVGGDVEVSGESKVIRIHPRARVTTDAQDITRERARGLYDHACTAQEVARLVIDRLSDPSACPPADNAVARALLAFSSQNDAAFALLVSTGMEVEDVRRLIAMARQAGAAGRSAVDHPPVTRADATAAPLPLPLSDEAHRSGWGGTRLCRWMARRRASRAPYA